MKKEKEPEIEIIDDLKITEEDLTEDSLFFDLKSFKKSDGECYFEKLSKVEKIEKNICF